MLHIENIAINRGDTAIIRQLGLVMMPGSLLVLRGGNGSGKTSLIRAIAGLLPLQSGQVRWQPKSETTEVLRDKDAVKNRLHYIGHDNALKAELSVYENLAYWAHMYDGALLIPPALHYFGLTGFAERRLGSLSAGWQRRVALARLLAISSTIWLLDEPANNLDVEGEGLLNALIASRCNNGGMVILSSHQPCAISHAQELWMEDFQ